MAKTITQEERQLIKLVEKMPVPQENRDSWLEQIRNGEMSKELAEEIRQRLSAPLEEGAEENSQHQANRARYLSEFALLVKRWQFSSQSHNFGRK